MFTCGMEKEKEEGFDCCFYFGFCFCIVFCYFFLFSFGFRVEMEIIYTHLSGYLVPRPGGMHYILFLVTYLHTDTPYHT